MLLLILSFLFESAFSQKATKKEAYRPKSFTFMNSQNREFTLTKENINRKPNFIKRLSKKILGTSSEGDDDSEGWYYIHIFDDNLDQVRRIVNINTENTLLKNTYAVYLKGTQASALENITLVHKLTKEDKFNEDGGSISATNYLHVITKEHSNIEERKGLYRIERQDDDHTFILEVEVKGLKEQEEMNKKKEAIEYLSSLRYVKTVSTFQYPKVKNAVFTGYTQKNYVPIQTDSTGLNYLPRYVNNQGYYGASQIVTIQDTPIDFNHAQFRDNNVQMQLNTRLNNHRKFVYYGSKSTSINDWNRKLEVNEHGTHVAGTTAGNIPNTNTNQYCPGSAAHYFDGNAPLAKILYAGDLNDVKSSDLGRLMKEYGSYISTNSWGVDGYNDNINHEYGKLALNNPDRLFLFAAGNEYSDGNFTVCDPGGSKNVLTVGAMGDFFNDMHTYSIQSTYGGTTYSALALLDADPWTVGSLGTSASSDIVAIDPSAGKQCDLINSGKISVLYASSRKDSSLKWIYDCQLESTSGILLVEDLSFRNLINSQVRINDVTKINSSYEIKHADYSSGGPANKGILKPDIMTPGTRIISAKSRPNAGNHGCNTYEGGDFTYMQGTSMATPNAAGAAALVRDYFSSSSWNVDLDGTTLRALMINSCKHPRGSLKPDILFGHGIVDLSTIIPFDGDNLGILMSYPRPIGSNAKLLQNLKPSVSSQQTVQSQFTVSATNGRPLQITLSYLDPIGDASSPIPIYNDLDLVVKSPSGKVYLGDHLETGDSQHASSNEKIIIQSNQVETGTYTIFVVAGEFVDPSQGPQEFAVVVSGPVPNDYLTFTQATTCPCQYCDSYNPTACQCQPQYIGNVCQAYVNDVTGNKYTVTVPPLEVARIYFRWNKEIKSIVAKSNNGGKGTTIWADRQCFLNLGSYQVNGGTKSFFGKGVSAELGTTDMCVAVFNNNYQTSTYEVEVSDKAVSKGFGKTNTIITVVCVIAGAAAIGLVVYCCCCRNRGGGTAVGDDGGGISQQSI